MAPPRTLCCKAGFSQALPYDPEAAQPFTGRASGEIKEGHRFGQIDLPLRQLVEQHAASELVDGLSCVISRDARLLSVILLDVSRSLG